MAVHERLNIVDYKKYRVIYLHEFSKSATEEATRLKKIQNRKTVIRLSNDSKEQAFNILKKANDE